jgi:hypothetical protein
MIIALSLLLLAPPEPILDPARDAPAPANAAFITDCISQAVATGAVTAQNRYLLFRCKGAPARAFYEKLATLPADKTATEVKGDWTWRFTTKPKKDTDGLDGCWQDSAAAGTEAEFGCRLIYPAGPFLDAG